MKAVGVFGHFGPQYTLPADRNHMPKAAFGLNRNSAVTK